MSSSTNESVMNHLIEDVVALQGGGRFTNEGSVAHGGRAPTVPPKDGAEPKEAVKPTPPRPAPRASRR